MPALSECLSRHRDLTPPETVETLRAAAKADGPRIQRVEVAGEIFWIKRPEKLSLRMRLQKGDATRAFAAEVAAHQDYANRGLPVAPVVLATDDYLVTRDCGPHLKYLARTEAPEFATALAAGAKALAQLHAQGVAHGRPSLKDICWQDGRIAFLDLERAGRGGSGARAMDALILIFSTAVETRNDLSAMETARNAYLAAGDPAVWTAARKRARRYRLLGWMLKPVVALLKGNREFEAIAPVLRFMGE